MNLYWSKRTCRFLPPLLLALIPPTEQVSPSAAFNATAIAYDDVVITHRWATANATTFFARRFATALVAHRYCITMLLDIHLTHLLLIIIIIFHFFILLYLLKLLLKSFSKIVATTAAQIC